jgi:hypothetical protein
MRALDAGEFAGVVARLQVAYQADPLMPEYGPLLYAFAEANAREAASRWRPQLPALLDALGVTATPEIIRRVLGNLFDVVRAEVILEPGYLFKDGGLAWNTHYTNSRIGVSLARELVPLFRAAPKRRGVAVIGDAEYWALDRHCYITYRCSATTRARHFDVKAWSAVFDMLDARHTWALQPERFDAAEIKRAFAATFKDMLNGEFGRAHAASNASARRSRKT